ncbi:VOC family protein [Arthrobacter sp. TMN-49]
MKPEAHLHIRIARPTHDIEAAIRYWVEGVGLLLQGRKEDGPSGHKLAFIGWPDAAWHLEIVEDHTLEPSPTAEDLLVIYLGEAIDEDSILRLEHAGGVRVLARNPYWDEHGMTFADADGYHLVLATRDWP